MKTTLSFLILLVLSSTTCGYGSMAISEQPSIDEMAEKAYLAFIGRVQHITIMETKTIYRFEVHEYIKESRDNITFKIQLSGGLKVITSPPSPTFEHGERYLVFLVDDARYTILYGHYGRLLLDVVDSGSLDVIRETYGSIPVYSLAGGVSMYNYTVIWENGTVTYTDPWAQREPSEISHIQPVGVTEIEKSDYVIERQLITSVLIVVIFSVIYFLLRRNQQ